MNENRNQADETVQYRHYGESGYINEGEEDQMEVEGYKRCLWYQILSWLSIILSLGFVRLIFFWFPKIHLRATHRRCPLGEADKVLLTDQYEKYKTFFIKDVAHGVIFDKSKGNIYSYANQGYEDTKHGDLSEVYDTVSSSIRVYFNDGYSKDINHYKMIRVKKLRYLWVEEKRKFLKLTGLGTGMKNSEIHNQQHLNPKLHRDLRNLYGMNEIIVHVQSYVTLLLIEISSPYYFFQFFSIVVWILDNYLYYTYAIIIVTTCGIAVTVIQTHRVQLKLRKTVQASEALSAEIITPGSGIKDTPCYNLVPGDRIVIPDNEEYTVPCDAVILSGSCIVRESMLTGESVPLTKTSLPLTEEDYNEKESTNHMLYSGTKVIQTRRDGDSPVIALVLRTGYVTAKGELVRAILYPPPVDYKFEQSIYTFINISAVGAFLLSIGTSVWLAMRKLPGLIVFAKSFELLTMVIPAAIPGALALCKAYSIQRFHKHKIACINSKVINVAGSTNCVCFDKTGTITEDGLDIWGVVPVHEGTFQESTNTPSSLHNTKFKIALASCHSLSLCNGKIVGDPLDAKMFESTGWIFEESKNASTGQHSTPIVYPNEMEKSNLVIKLLHQNQFVSNLQRMSIITKKNESETFDLFCKGSPEMLASLSHASSVPSNMEQVLHDYTKKGYRVLALGWRKLEMQPLEQLKKTSRADMEKDMEFLGLLIMENKVKPASKPTITILKHGKIKITMITGDNIQTAISVSRECGIILPNEDLAEIDEADGKLVCTVGNKIQTSLFQTDLIKAEDGFLDRPYVIALTGKAWEVIKQKHEDSIPQILVRTAIFARMASKQKQQVVTDLQTLGYSVVMCGDGANDCAALKASNVGVSLSETEASVASPLSSAKQDISCVPTVIREGRSSLIASFGLIKFILCYGYIQLTSCLILYALGYTLSNFEFIWEDICLVVPLSCFYALTNTYEGEIVPYAPPKKMLNFIPICSMTVHMIIFIGFQFFSYFWIQTYPWYVDGTVEKNLPQPTDVMVGFTYRNYALFSISIFQIIISAIIFSQGYPYRKALHTNIIYILTIIITTILSGFIVVQPGVWVQELLTLALPPVHFRYLVLVMAFVNFVICYIIEKGLFEYILSKKCTNLSWNGRNKKSKYEIIQDETLGMSWLSSVVDAYSYVDVKERLSITDFPPGFRE